MKHAMIFHLGWVLMLVLGTARASEQMPLEPFPTHMKSPWQTVTDVNAASMSELRAMAEEAPDIMVQGDAVRMLVKMTDVPTIARLVYAFRRGNHEARRALLDQPSASMIPYLLEDVAHGSLVISSRGGWDVIEDMRVRQAAAEIMLNSIVRIAGLTAEAEAWLNQLRGGTRHFFSLPEHSKALLEWWENNGLAVLAGRAYQATWLPTQRDLRPLVFEQWEKEYSKKPPPPPPAKPPPSLEPWSALPLHVDEPFAVWFERVSDPQRRDVKWQSIDFEHGVSVPVAAGSNALLQSNSGDPSSLSEAARPRRLRKVLKNLSPVAAVGEDYSATFWETLAFACIASLSAGTWLLYRKWN